MDDLFKQYLGDENGARIGQFAITTLVVLVLLLAVYWLGRRIWSGYSGGIQRSRVPRLAILDVLPIDGRRRLLLIRRDAVEHLILVGGSTDLVVEPSILRARQRMAPAMLGGPASLPGGPQYHGGSEAEASASSPGLLAPGAEQRLAGNDAAPVSYPFSRIAPAPEPDRPPDVRLKADDAASDPDFGPLPAWLGRPDSPDKPETGASELHTEPSPYARREPPAAPMFSAAGPSAGARNRNGNGSGHYEAAEPDLGSPPPDNAAARVSELEAEMNRLLGELSADHRSH